MADGCNLYLSGKDFDQIDESRHKRGEANEISDIIIRNLEKPTAAIAEKVTYPLSDPNHPAHKVFVDHILRNVSANKSIPDSYKHELPKAVAIIAKVTPNVVGLIRPAKDWGPRAHAIDERGKLGHKTRGAGFAAELIVTAALITKGSTPGNGSKRLQISSTDRVDLGIKLQASYKGATIIDQPKRGTVEADVFIQRSGAPIGVDVKHAQNGGRYTGAISESQVAEIRVAIRHGEIGEFHFVTNGSFSPGVKELIDSANEKLGASDAPKLLWHEHVWT